MAFLYPDVNCCVVYYSIISSKVPIYKLWHVLTVVFRFYEWKKDGSKKQPYYIHFKDGRALVFAALYDSWKNPEGEALLLSIDGVCGKLADIVVKFENFVLKLIVLSFVVDPSFGCCFWWYAWYLLHISMATCYDFNWSFHYICMASARFIYSELSYWLIHCFPAGEILYTFTILTTSSSSALEWLHG